jgi:hypothetical protein
MGELSKTGHGLFSTLKDNWNLLLAAFGENFESVAKDGIGGLIEQLKALRESGDLEWWAEGAKETIAALGRMLKGLVAEIAGTVAFFTELKNAKLSEFGPTILKRAHAAYQKKAEAVFAAPMLGGGKAAGGGTAPGGETTGTKAIPGIEGMAATAAAEKPKDTRKMADIEHDILKRTLRLRQLQSEASARAKPTAAPGERLQQLAAAGPAAFGGGDAEELSRTEQGTLGRIKHKMRSKLFSGHLTGHEKKVLKKAQAAEGKKKGGADATVWLVGADDKINLGGMGE